MTDHVRDPEGAFVASQGAGGNAAVCKEDGAARGEMLFERAFEQGPIGVALIGLDGRYMHVNAAFCEISGYSGADLRLLDVAETTHPDDIAADIAAMDGLLNGENRYYLEKRSLTPSGDIVWVANATSLVRSDEGAPQYFVCHVKDVADRRRMDDVLRDERRRLHEAQSVGRLGSWELDIATGTLSCTEMLLELYGVDRAHFTVDHAAALDCIEPEDSKLVEAARTECMTTGEPMRVRYRVRRPSDGEQRWFDARAECVVEDGRPLRLAGTVSDVTEEVRAKAELGAAHAFQQAVMSASPDLFYVRDVATGTRVWANRSPSELLGFNTAEWAALGGDDSLDSRILEEDLPKLAKARAAARTATDGEITELIYRMRHKDGTPRWISARTTPLSRDDSGHVAQFVAVSRDISHQVAAADRLEHAALYDELTGLANRRLLTERLTEALGRSEDGREVVVIFCDLDGFKRVNDVYGHGTGDAVLVETAVRIMAVTRSSDTVARMGGDEFVVICEAGRGTDPSARGMSVARRVERAMSEPMRLDGVDHSVTMSAGIFVAGQGDDADAVLRNADAAMYLAKSRGKNCYAVFDSAMRREGLERDDIERQLRSAIVTNAIEVHFQPIVEPGTGRVRGVEALVRVPDGSGRYLDTARAVAVAEQTSLISAIDERVLTLACEQAAAWRLRPEHADLTVAVNRSAAEIARPGFYDRIIETVAASGLDLRALTIEITETVLLEVAPDTVDDLRRLHDLGVGIAIDDFGTGYASLHYLATLPITCLKVDRSFTAGLPGDPISSTILRATVGLAADLGIDCVIEGIETTTQLAALPDSRRMLAQGYLWARPQPASADLPTNFDVRQAASSL